MTRNLLSWLAAVVFAAAAPVLPRPLQSPQAPSEPPTALTAGAALERPLTGAERHVYEIQLQAGQAARLTIDQRGVDVAVRILDASGAIVATFDDEMLKEGQEHAVVVADTQGAYRFSIAARYGKHDPGSYAVRIDEIRTATDQDRGLYEARRLGTEAGTLHTAGKFDEALVKATQALALAKSALGPDTAYVGSLLATIATVQRSKGQEKESEESYLRSIAVYETALGRVHPKTAASIESLAVLYLAMEDYARAEPLLFEAAAINERTLGEHPRLAISLRDLSILHKLRGDNPRALEELQRALKITDRTMSPDEFEAIANVNNIGDLYLTMKDYDRAQPFAERALRDLERTMGPDNFRVSTPLLNLSIIARERGDYARALEYLTRAYAVRVKTYGQEHTESASLLIVLGNIYHAQGEYQSALDAYQRAQATLERTAGPYHSYTLMAINNAARTHIAAGDIPTALQELTRFDALLDKEITFNLAIGSDREKLAYIEQTYERMGRAISLHLRQAPGNPQAADLAMLSILRRKGRVLDASLGSRDALRARLDAGDRALLDELSVVTAQLSTLALKGPGRTPPADYKAQLAALDAKHEALESRISQRSAAYRADHQDATLAAVRAALPADSALIEFAVYQPFDPKAVSDAAAHGEPHYAAYVMQRAAGPRGVDLGPAKAIDALVARVRLALRDPSRRDATTLARTLDESVLGPIRALAGNARQLLIAPDGALSLVPFEAFVDERGRFQVERYAISYLGSGRDLLRMQVPRASVDAPLVMADPAFGTLASPRAGTGGDPRGAGTAGQPSAYFSRLGGTAQEAAAIGRLLPGATVLTGGRATKAALTHANAPAILHLASHAFFLPDAAEKGGTMAGTRAMTLKVESPNPLLRSGIALAGANLARDGDAGILTALEASTLNLWGTKLVTLSACDTGVGEVKNGEGVYGLRRAFFLAGTETLVMSLWPVSDYVTRGVMTGYYTGVTRGLGRGAALRRVQLEMIADKSRRHPFYWAGFIQAGDWTPLPAARVTTR